MLLYQTLSKAQAARVYQASRITTAGANEILASVQGAYLKYFQAIIPKSREAEFNTAVNSNDYETQIKFKLVEYRSKQRAGAETDIPYNTIFEEEYTKEFT